MLDRLRERIEVFLEASARDRCHFELEHRPEVHLGARYARAGDLFSQDRIRDVQRALAGASGTEEKQVRHLLEFMALAYARCVAAGELDRLRTWMAHASLPVREETVPLRAIPAALRRTADRSLRADLEEARLSAVDEQVPLIEGLAARLRDAVQELGYGGFVESWEVLSGVDLRGMARDAERFLSDTDSLYHDLLSWYLPRLAGAEVGEGEAPDAARLEQAEPYLEYFADRSLLGRVQAALMGAGIDPDAGGRLQTATRPALIGGVGAVACALRVPDEVTLTVSEEPGRPVKASLLHGFGYALQRAYTSAEHPFEFRWLGDGAVPAGFGRVLEGLLGNRAFLARECGLPRARMADYLRLSVLLDLLRVRRQAALLQLELTAHSEPGARETADRYVELLGRATGLRHDPRGALWALRPPFRVATSLRAEQWGAALGGHLRDRFDEDWWRNPRAGPLLRDLLESGQSFSAAEMSIQLVSQPLSFERVRESLEERL